MRPLATITALLTSAAILGGCGAVHSAQQNAANSFHQSFRTSFKTSFMKSCTAQGAPEKYCGCVEATVERKYTDEQIIKMTTGGDATDTRLRDAADSCRGTR